MATYTAPTDNYRKVRPTDPEYIANLPRSLPATENIMGIVSGSATAHNFGLGNNVVANSGLFYGRAEEGGGNIAVLGWRLRGRLYGCANQTGQQFALQQYQFPSNRSVSNQNFTVCGVGFRPTSNRIQVFRTDQFITEDDAGLTEHWKYDSTVRKGQELDDGRDHPAVPKEAKRIYVGNKHVFPIDRLSV